MSESSFEACGHCSKGSSTTVPKCPHCGVRKSAVAKAAPIVKRVDETPDPVAAYQRAYDAFEAKFEAFTKANVGAGVSKFLQTDEGRTLATACNEARVELDMAQRAPAQVTVETRLAKAAAQTDAFEALEAGLTAFCKSKGISVAKAWTEGLGAFEQTTEGAALKAAYDEA